MRKVSSFLAISLMETVSGLAQTTQILMTGYSSTTNSTSDSGSYGVGILSLGAAFLEMFALKYTKKIWQSENIEKATKNHIHVDYTDSGCSQLFYCRIKIGDIITKDQIAEFGFGAFTS